jgi:pimeloyl-ACP methyl ester carboxylesterase
VTGFTITSVNMRNEQFARRRPLGLVGAVVLAGVALAGVGCSSPSMQPGDLSLVQTYSDAPRAGNVYLLRGFIGIWSTGIDALGKKINDDGVRAVVYRNEQWKEVRDTLIEKYENQKVYEPLVLVGHSWGADHTLDIARALDEKHIAVDLIVTLDPVTPPLVPKNVRWMYNIYQTNGMWQGVPIFRGVPVDLEDDAKGKVVLENLAVRENRTDLLEPDTDHYNIEKNVKVHAEVLKVLKKACPDRGVWTRANPGYRPPVPAIAAGTGAGQAITARHTAPAGQARPVVPQPQPQQPRPAAAKPATGGQSPQAKGASMTRAASVEQAAPSFTGQ